MRDQHKLKHMMAYDPAHNPRKRRAPTPRPDYVIVQSGKVRSILDAKYRDLWELDLPSHWLYQLAMYALSQPEGMDAIILYPTMEEEAREARIEINDPMYGTGRAHVILRPVHLLKLDRLIAGERNTVKGFAAASAYARRLAFGEGVMR